MGTATYQTKVAVFKSREAADAAISELYRAGFRESEIGLVHRNTQGIERSSDRNKTAGWDDDAADDATGGAVAGAVTGLGVGALIGAGVLAGVIPVVGPALFAGTLGVLASNAAGGAAVVGLVGALTGWGLSEEDATYYEGEVSAGRSIVTVTSARSEEAELIMRRQGGTPRQRSSSQTSMR